MNKFLSGLLFAPALCLHLGAQTAQETMTYIVQEFKSYETESHLIKDVQFSANGSVFEFKSYIPVTPEVKISIPLAQVHIFVTNKSTDTGLHRYDLVVESKGRKGKFQVNGNNTSGIHFLLKGVSNKKRVQSLQKAFAHLTSLINKDAPKPLF